MNNPESTKSEQAKMERFGKGTDALSNIKDTTTLLGMVYKREIGESMPGLGVLNKTLKTGTEYTKCLESGSNELGLCTVQNTLAGEVVNKLPGLKHPAVKTVVTLSRIYNRNISELQSRLNTLDIETKILDRHYQECVSKASGNFDNFICELEKIMTMSNNARARGMEVNAMAIDQALRAPGKLESGLVSKFKHK